MLTTTNAIENFSHNEQQEKETAAFLKALEDPETREKITQLLEEAGLLL